MVSCYLLEFARQLERVQSTFSIGNWLQPLMGRSSWHCAVIQSVMEESIRALRNHES